MILTRSFPKPSGLICGSLQHTNSSGNPGDIKVYSFHLQRCRTGRRIHPWCQHVDMWKGCLCSQGESFHNMFGATLLCSAPNSLHSKYIFLEANKVPQSQQDLVWESGTCCTLKAGGTVAVVSQLNLAHGQQKQHLNTDWLVIKTQTVSPPSVCLSRNEEQNRPSFFSSSLQLSAWWAGAHCSLRFLFLAGRSGTWRGASEVVTHLPRGWTCGTFRDVILSTTAVEKWLSESL